MKRALQRHRCLLLALPIPFAATLVQWLSWDLVKPSSWFFYYPAAFAAALVGGRCGGIAATLMSALLGYYLFNPPPFSFRLRETSTLASAAMFTLMGIVFSLFHERLRVLSQKAAQRESEERFAAFMKAIPARAWIKDEQGRYVYANRCFEQDGMRGRTDYRGRTDAELFPAALAEQFQQSDRAVLSRGQPLAFFEELEGPEGTTRHWQSVKFPLEDATGRRHVGGIAIEITRQRQAGVALRLAEATLELAQQAAGAGTWSWDMRTNELQWSPQMFRLFGLDPTTAPASFATWRGVLLDQDRHQAEERIAEAIQQRQRLDNVYRIVLPTREVRWIHALGDTLYDEKGTPVSMAGICLDITARKESEERLRTSEERYRLLAENVEDFVLLEDREGRHLYISPSYGRVTGWTLEEVEASDWRTRVHAEDLPHIEACKAAGRAGQSTIFEHRIRCRDGRWIWVEQHCKPIRDASGQVSRLMVSARDITLRKQAETDMWRVNRTLRIIKRCNRILVRASDESEVLQAICGVIVGTGGYRMAWVGYAQPDEARSVRPMASAGFVQGYVDRLHLTWADTGPGRGPTGQAIRSRQPVIVHDVLADPALSSWHDLLREHGYLAMGAFPLQHERQVFGALMVYATNVQAFGPEEVSLLAELADNVAFGIAALRTRLQERQAQEELHRLSARLIEVQDEERRHLARELHDTTAQDLAALTLNLANLGKLLAGTPAPAPTLCADCLRLARQSAEEIRTQSYLLHPPLLEVMGLTGALEDYAQGFSARSGIAIEVNVPAGFGRLPEATELALFRVVQESLANVLKHSRSPRAEIRLARQASVVTLEVRDVGQGIPATALARLRDMKGGSGVGLGGMQERLRPLGGRLEIESGPTGTTIRTTLPLKGQPVEASPGVQHPADDPV